MLTYNNNSEITQLQNFSTNLYISSPYAKLNINQIKKRTYITNPIYPTTVSCYPFDEPEKRREDTETTVTET